MKRTLTMALILAAGLSACRTRENPDAGEIGDDTNGSPDMVDFDLDGREDGMADGQNLTDGLVGPLYGHPDLTQNWLMVHQKSYDAADPENDAPRIRFNSEDGGIGYVEGSDDVKFYCADGSGSSIPTCSPTDGWYVFYLGDLPHGELIFTVVSYASDEPRLNFGSAEDAAYDALYWRDGQACVVVTSAGLEPPQANSCEGLAL